jgi:hypothetical protein
LEAYVYSSADRAKEWERNGTDSSFLLRGKDLSEAEQWMVRSAEKEPKPMALHSQYILTSRQAATRRVTRDFTPDECKRYFQSEKCPPLP